MCEAGRRRLTVFVGKGECKTRDGWRSRPTSNWGWNLVWCVWLSKWDDCKTGSQPIKDIPQPISLGIWIYNEGWYPYLWQVAIILLYLVGFVFRCAISDYVKVESKQNLQPTTYRLVSRLTGLERVDTDVHNKKTIVVRLKRGWPPDDQHRFCGLLTPPLPILPEPKSLWYCIGLQ